MRGIWWMMALASTLLAQEGLYYINNGKKIFLTPIDKSVQTRSTRKVAYYRLRDGREVAVADRILLRLADPAKLKSYLQSYGLRLLRRYDVPGLFLLEAGDAERAIAVANALSRESDVLFAQPDVGRKRSLR